MNIKDYLPFYLGGKVKTTGGKFATLVSVSTDGMAIIVYDNEDPRGRVIMQSAIKPILRPLSDIQLNEMKEFFSFTGLPKDCAPTRADFSDHIFQLEYTSGGAIQFTHSYLYHLSPKQFHWLLSKHFDLFGLIDAGLAIDATTLPITQ